MIIAYSLNKIAHYFSVPNDIVILEESFMMKYQHACLVLLSLLFSITLTACRTNTPKSEEVLLQLAFEAIQEQDWEKFQRLSITPSDFIVAEKNLSKFAESQQYEVQVLRPEEQAVLRTAFAKAGSKEPGTINFTDASFEGIGTMIRTGDYEVMEVQEPVEFKQYSLKLELNGETIDTKDLYPQFQVVYFRWEEEYRIIGLVFNK